MKQSDRRTNETIRQTDKWNNQTHGQIKKNFIVFSGHAARDRPQPPDDQRADWQRWIRSRNPKKSDGRDPRTFSARRRHHRVPQIRPSSPIHPWPELRLSPGEPEAREGPQAPSHAGWRQLEEETYPGKELFKSESWKMAA